MRADLRHALRQLRRAPGFAAVVVLCLAVGIGINVATFGAVDALLFRAPAGVAAVGAVRRLRPETLPVPGQQVFLDEGFSRPELAALRARRDGWTGLAEWSAQSAVLGEGAGARRQPVALVGRDYFRVLGVRPALGRAFTGDEHEPGGAAVAVASHRYWRTALGGDPSAVGRPVRLNGRPVLVVGVAPRDFAGLELEPPALFLPFGMAAAVGLPPQFTDGTEIRWIDAAVRLAPGVDARRAAAVATTVVRGVQAARPNDVPGFTDLPRTVRAAALTERFGGAFRQRSPVPAWILGATGTVLLVVCANVAGLLLVRAERRRREIAVRLAVGAGRARVVRQLLVEGAVLAVLGGALGLALAVAGARLWLLLPDMPQLERVVDGRAALAALGATLLTTLAFALAPAWQAARGDAGELLRAGARQTARPTRVRGALLAVQFAAALALLGVGGLFVRSLQAVRAVDVGFDHERLLVATVDWDAFGIPGPEAGRLMQQAAERARRLPGVADAGLTGLAPFQGAMMATLAIPDRPDAARLSGLPGGMFYRSTIDPAYLRTMRIPVVRGRALTAADAPGPDRPNGAILVNETFARRVWPREEAIGKCVGENAADPGRCTRVVGVVRDVRFTSLTSPVPPAYYVPAAARLAGPVTLVVRLRDGATPERVTPALRALLQSLDPRAPFATVRPIGEALLRSQLQPYRTSAAAFTAFGAVALVLAAVGLYGVVAYAVAQRTGEFGIRLALGARGADVARLVLGQGVRTALVGALLGVVGAAAAGRLLRAQLHGVGTIDPLTLAAVALLLGAVAVVAAWLPARRAARVDPIAALRAE